MSEFYQSNRERSESYRNDLRQKVDALMCLDDLKTACNGDTQKFYLEFKSRLLPLTEQETENNKRTLANIDNCHFLLLKQAALIDIVIQTSFRTAIWFYNHTQNKALKEQDVPVAIVARGGYGREEIYSRSDVDLQIVMDSSASPPVLKETKAVLKQFEYLFTFQDIFPTASSSSFLETEAMDQELTSKPLADFFSLLEHRFVVGNPIVYAQFKSSIKTAALLHKEKIIEHCLAQSGCYEVQNTVFKQEPNIKDELRRLYWALMLARVKHGLETVNQFELLYELYERKILSALAFKNMQTALNFLSKLRLFLHCTQKGSHRDVMSYEVRETMAQSMGFGSDVKMFYKEYFYKAVYPLKRYSRNLFWECATPDTTKVKNLSGIFALNSEDQIIFDGDPEETFSYHPESIFKVFAWVAEKNYFLSYSITRAIEHHIDQMGPIFMDEDGRKDVLSYFKRVISGRYFAKSLRLLHEFGLLGNYFLPEFKNICGLLQDIYVHQFPADMHVLSALDQLNKLELEEDVDPFLAELYHSLKDKTGMKLAVLLHDIGKGVKLEGQNEELLGARMVPSILNNLGYGEKPRRIQDVAFLVEKHLMMRDLMLLDPEADDTYDMIWDLVNHDKERLKMLVLLTFADRGGTKMKLSASQIEQLKMFYQYTLYHKKRENVPQAIKLEFLKMVRLPRDLQTQLEIYNEFCQGKEQFAAELLFKPGQPSELVVCAKDQQGLLFNISTVLAFHGLNIVEANIQTLRDNVFDVFKVIGSDGNPIEYSNSFYLQNQVKKDLEKIFVKKQSLAEVYKGRKLPKPADEEKFKDLRLRVKIIGRSIKVDTQDQLGTFMMLTRVFSQFNMEIQKAVLHTQHGTASNIFYLRPGDVERIMQNEEQFITILQQTLNCLLESESVLLEQPA